MKNLLIWFFVLTAGCQICLGEDANLPCRFTEDYRQCFLYVATNIAIIKSTRTELDDSYKTYFSVSYANWMGVPDAADSTGDRDVGDMISSPKQIGMDNERKWLLASGQDFDFHKWVATNLVVLIHLPVNKVYSASDMASLKINLKAEGIAIPPIALEPVEVFFDRQLVSRLTPNMRR
jgi:hypothetical protein